MRNLQFQDIFKMIRILKKAGLSRQARVLMIQAAETEGELDPKNLGMDFIFSVLENLGEAEDEVYTFLADLSGKAFDEIKKMELEETVGLFEDFLDIPNLKSFFSKVFKLMK